MERRRHSSGGPRPDITAPPLDLSGLGTTRAARAWRRRDARRRGLDAATMIAERGAATASKHYVA
jgi:hypothetical protein